ncbi:MAG: hypothetical protein ACM3U2_15645 [Deltaproteobacteria bacterium]
MPQPPGDALEKKLPAEIAPEPSRPAPPVPIELHPYHVQIQVGFENDPQFSDEFRRSVLDGIREGLERYVGAFWQSTIAEEQGRIFAGLAALRRLRVDALPKDALSGEMQKAYLLSVQTSGPGYRVAGREWDVITHQLGELAFRSVPERSEISEAVLAVLRDVFRPLAAVETSKSGTVTLRARGGEFPPRDAAWLPLQPGRTFEVYYCFLNKDRAIERVQQVPFTYLTAGEETGRGVAAGVVASGLRAPLTSRRRIQVLALAITRRHRETQLTMITRPPARKPLGGVEVEISRDPAFPEEAGKKAAEVHGKLDGKLQEPQPETERQEKEDEQPPLQPEKLPRLVADRSGMVKLSSGLSPIGLPLWLFVKSGQALLARVPIVPGAQSAAVLELPDDTLRLEIEGSISTLQAELVDAVARRAVLMSLARARAKAGQWEAMIEALKQLDDMPRAASFAVNINAIRQPALKAARARRDRTTEERVTKLCDETLELVTNYLDEEKLKELKEELNEMRQIAADEAAAEAQAKAGGERPAAPSPAGGAKKKKKKAVPAPAAPASPKPPPGF